MDLAAVCPVYLLHLSRGWAYVPDFSAGSERYEIAAEHTARGPLAPRVGLESRLDSPIASSELKQTSETRVPCRYSRDQCEPINCPPVSPDTLEIPALHLKSVIGMH